MSNVIELLAKYKSVHLNAKNIASHFIGIPLILWAVANVLARGGIDVLSIFISYLLIISVVLFLYYLFLHVGLAIVAMIIYMPLFMHAGVYVDTSYGLPLLVFIIGWLFQFVGHYFEKAKPAFFDDIKQLAIGPLFLISELLLLLGCYKSMAKMIEERALIIRKEHFRL